MAAIVAVVAAYGVLLYKMHQVQKAKDTMLEEIDSNRKYRYKSIDDLYNSLKKTYDMAIDTKKEIADLAGGNTIEEATGHKIGWFTSNWRDSFIRPVGGKFLGGFLPPKHTTAEALNLDAIEAIEILAKIDSQERINAGFVSA